MTLIEEMIKTINSTGDHRVISRFKPINCYNESDDNHQKSIGIFLDIETTGVDVTTDKITELALVPFEYGLDGRVYKVLEPYVGFQDPKFPIPENIVALTGITDEMVTDKFLSEDRINELVNSAAIIIAHNAAFDKKFLAKEFPIFRDKLWGCTAKHVEWQNEDIPMSKLEYLAYVYGIFYKGHRAEIDSLVGIHLLTQQLPLSKRLVLEALLQSANSKYYRIWAENSPFDKKDLLKRRKYRWNDGRNSGPKSWYSIVNEKHKDEELSFLCDNVYGRKVIIRIEIVTLCDDI